MIETLASQPTQSVSPVPHEETLRLKCPRCVGGLNLKRKHLGVTGQCVHCQSPLTTRQENGMIRVVSGDVDGLFEDPKSATTLAEPVTMHAVPASISAELPTLPVSRPALLPTRPDDNLFPAQVSESEATVPSRETKVEPSPFGDTSGFSLPFAGLFGDDEPSASVQPGWGTKVPLESHASISPFGTGSADGGGFAESLFREKVEKAIETTTPAAGGFSLSFAPSRPTESAPAISDAPKRDNQERVILDGDGRPLRPMTKEEEASFATNFFKYENSRTKPRWVKRLMKKLIRLLTVLCILGAIAAVAACFVPKEKLLVWKEKAIVWLEPGMAIFDYLPEKLRPDWIPQTKFGIDAGVDENGQPKKKLNAFEGLDKLKGDVGNMRGAAEDELKALQNF